MLYKYIRFLPLFSFAWCIVFICIIWFFLILITHPLIFARFDWLPYITWCKITGQFSRNNPRLRRYLTDYYFSRKETEQVGKSQLKSLTFKRKKNEPTMQSPVTVILKSWSEMLHQKVQKKSTKIAFNARYENVGVIKWINPPLALQYVGW